MKTIIVTGSTRGIGYGLAKNFLNSGHQVVISGRRQENVDKVVINLIKDFPAERLLGVACDMRDFQRVELLWQSTLDHFGKVDIWINNAGISQPQENFWELDPGTITDLVDTNISGAMFGARVALAGFMKQGRGAFYNMEGLGSDGRRVEGLTLYGTSKSALHYLSQALAAEVKGTEVIVGAISPGMVLTDFILKRYENREPEEWESARKIFNILADKVETVTPFLAEQILANTKNGKTISWLTPGKAFWRFLTAPISKRDLFADIDL